VRNISLYAGVATASHIQAFKIVLIMQGERMQLILYSKFSTVSPPSHSKTLNIETF
jgi:hypothetical protein